MKGINKTSLLILLTLLVGFWGIRCGKPPQLTEDQAIRDAARYLYSIGARYANELSDIEELWKEENLEVVKIEYDEYEKDIAYAFVVNKKLPLFRVTIQYQLSKHGWKVKAIEG